MAKADLPNEAAIFNFSYRQIYVGWSTVQVLKEQELLLLLAFQFISGHVRAHFSSSPGIPTPRFKRGRLHSNFIGFDMHAESLSV